MFRRDADSEYALSLMVIHVLGGLGGLAVKIFAEINMWTVSNAEVHKEREYSDYSMRKSGKAGMSSFPAFLSSKFIFFGCGCAGL